MQMFTLSRRAVASSIVVVLTVCTLIHGRKAQQIQAARDAPFGRYTAQQMLDATTPICQRLLPFSKGLQLVAEPHSHYADHGTGRCLWEVDCYDDRRQEVGYFWWDAQTGRLTRFALSSSVARADPPARLSSGAAVAWARHGIEALGWGPGAPWQVCEVPRLAAGNWIIVLGNKARRIRTQIDARSGLIVSAMQEATH